MKGRERNAKMERTNRGTHHKDASGKHHDSNRGYDPIDILFRGPCKDEQSARRHRGGEDAGQKSMLGHPDAVLHRVGLVDEPHEQKIGRGANGTGDDQSQENHAHDPDREAVCVHVYDGKGLEEGVLKHRAQGVISDLYLD